MYGKPKMCSICKVKPATKFYKEVLNGQSVEICLCDKCAADCDLDNHYNVFLSSLFKDIFDDDYNDYDDEYVEKLPKKTCKCGCTEDDILRTGRFGCSECYKTFSNLVNKYVDRLGGKTYSGKMPDHIIKPEVVPPTIDDKIKELKLKMIEAANNQNFDLAQKLKEQIAQMKSGN